MRRSGLAAAAALLAACGASHSRDARESRGPDSDVDDGADRRTSDAGDATTEELDAADGSEEIIVDIAAQWELCAGPVGYKSWPEIREFHWKVRLGSQRRVVMGEAQELIQDTSHDEYMGAPLPLQFEILDPEPHPVDVQLDAVVLKDRDLLAREAPGRHMLRAETNYEVPSLSEDELFATILYAEVAAGEEFALNFGEGSNVLWYQCARSNENPRSCHWRMPMYACDHPAGTTTRTKVSLEGGDTLVFEIFRLAQPDAPLNRVRSVTGTIDDVDLSTDEYFDLLYGVNYPRGPIEHYAVMAPADAPFGGVVVEGVNTGGEDDGGATPLRASLVDRDFNEIEPLEVLSVEFQ